MRLNARRTSRALVGLILSVGLVAACTPNDSGAGEIPGQGYVSGDGSVRVYEAGNREGPVVVAGTSFEGDRVDSGSWAGDVVVLNTWYASCAPCRAEAPGLVELANEFDEVRFIGINTRDDAGAALPFQRTYDIPYPSIEDRTGEVVARLSGVVPLQAVPTTVVLDGSGKVAARVIGQVEKSVLEDLIEEIRSGRS